MLQVSVAGATAPVTVAAAVDAVVVVTSAAAVDTVVAVIVVAVSAVAVVGAASGTIVKVDNESGFSLAGCRCLCI